MQLFVNDLTVMDFSYLCPKRGMVGESWIVDVVLAGELNEESMIQDFGKVKKDLKRLIDEYVDHKLLVPVESSCTKVIHHTDTGMVQVNFNRKSNANDEASIYLYCPDEAYAFVYAEEVDMASVSQYLKDIIATHLPDNVDDITLQLRTESIPTPFYHYTHGLKKHDGNCQRIAHGHRSKVIVYEHGKESIQAEEYWAERWRDIYIGSQDDVVAPQDLHLTDVEHSLDYAHCFAYEASQGYFELVIAQAESEIIATDSTVECLAQFMLDEQRRLCGHDEVKVIAFEGVGKGAIANA